MQALLPTEQQEVDDAGLSSPESHHYISKSQHNPINIYAFVLANPDDPAKKVNIHGYEIKTLFIFFDVEFYQFPERPPFRASSWA